MLLDSPQVFWYELCFVKMTHVDQQRQITHELPSVEQYMQRRIGSSAVRLCLAVNE